MNDIQALPKSSIERIVGNGSRKCCRFQLEQLYKSLNSGEFADLKMMVFAGAFESSSLEDDQLINQILNDIGDAPLFENIDPSEREMILRSGFAAGSVVKQNMTGENEDRNNG